ncbi:Copper transport protein YcnJ precursor [Nonomuraea coxensis DSM 45129]|uniref:Copper transport protein YcnJ n=1 Tax=Nonomuraea coxensis DSM 45129 TaxID=1122611 RepID=A0ABX8U7J8_9ACTN|nr:copper resistance CopC family protein [Nonomuraea coxensis]QYC43700.1 Copper transport protein YcnJ precursor [Nonomuraea coxensis DSM 45129]
MRRLLTVLLLACVAAVTVPPYAAQAHNVLVGSDPKEGATLTAAPARVTLVFDQAVRQGYAQIGVTGADGSSWADGDAVVAAERVSVKLKPLPGGGAYVVGYRILSADGHPVTGKLTFTLAPAGAPSPDAAGAPDAAATPDSAAATDSAAAPDAAAASDAAGASGAAAAEAAANGGAGMAVVWIIGALVLLAAGTAVALRRAPAPVAPRAPGSVGVAEDVEGEGARS